MQKDRILARLDALNISQFEAAKRAGKGTNFLYDLLNGRKQDVKGEGPARLARALECSVEYLRGQDDEVGYPPGVQRPDNRAAGRKAASSILLAGPVETDVFRAARLRSEPKPAPFAIPHDPRFEAGDQLAYLVRGAGLSAMGIVEGMIIIAVARSAYEAQEGAVKSGDVVVCQRARNDGTEFEISARKLAFFEGGVELQALDTTGGDPVRARSLSSGEVTILGVMTMAVVVI